MRLHFYGGFFFKWSLVMTTLCMSFHTFLLSKQYWRTPGFNFPGSSRAKCQGPQVTQTASRMSRSSIWGISVLTLWRQASIPLGHDGMWWLKYLKSWFFFFFLSWDSSLLDSIPALSYELFKCITKGQNVPMLYWMYRCEWHNPLKSLSLFNFLCFSLQFGCKVLNRHLQASDTR